MNAPQLEKIANAMHALLDATPEVASISAAKDAYGRRVVFYPSNDDAVHAMCSTLGIAVERLDYGNGWYLAASGDVGGNRISVIGPTHRIVAHRSDEADAKIDGALACVADAIGGVA